MNELIIFKMMKFIIKYGIMIEVDGDKYYENECNYND